MRRERESGQAVVEAALTLPLTVFLIVGTLQLFLMMHARILTQYAAYRATRAGSVNHGNCARMVHTAILSVLPAIESFAGPRRGPNVMTNMAEAFGQRRNNQYNDRASSGGVWNNYTGTIIWIIRDAPTPAQVAARANNGQDTEFDQPGNLMRLETRLIFWYPMRIPFANWVMGRIFLANFRLQNYLYQNPLMPVRRSADFANQDWMATTGGGYTLPGEIATEMASRINRGEFVFPITATYTMRMMTPAKQVNFQTKNCPPTPETL